jgi:hypothetical protein
VQREHREPPTPEPVPVMQRLVTWGPYLATIGLVIAAVAIAVIAFGFIVAGVIGNQNNLIHQQAVKSDLRNEQLAAVEKEDCEQAAIDRTVEKFLPSAPTPALRAAGLADQVRLLRVRIVTFLADVDKHDPDCHETASGVEAPGAGLTPAPGTTGVPAVPVPGSANAATHDAKAGGGQQDDGQPAGRTTPHPTVTVTRPAAGGHPTRTPTPTELVRVCATTLILDGCVHL